MIKRNLGGGGGRPSVSWSLILMRMSSMSRERFQIAMKRYLIAKLARP